MRTWILAHIWTCCLFNVTSERKAHYPEDSMKTSYLTHPGMDATWLRELHSRNLRFETRGYVCHDPQMGFPLLARDGVIWSNFTFAYWTYVTPVEFGHIIEMMNISNQSSKKASRKGELSKCWYMKEAEILVKHWTKYTEAKTSNAEEQRLISERLSKWFRPKKNIDLQLFEVFILNRVGQISTKCESAFSTKSNLGWLSPTRVIWSKFSIKTN